MIKIINRSKLKIYLALYPLIVLKFKSGGYFINILSDAFLTNTYYKEFREFLIAELDIFELCLTPRDLFRHINADVGTCIIFGQKNFNRYCF